ncbi:hypothetical protein LY76DRAFT_249357 [Colletotrichum caudatum]|nr:hypothetical protein LY76DRAFT_249357 [Colletotrichum caudatum]
MNLVVVLTSPSQPAPRASKNRQTPSTGIDTHLEKCRATFSTRFPRASRSRQRLDAAPFPSPLNLPFPSRVRFHLPRIFSPHASRQHRIRIPRFPSTSAAELHPSISVSLFLRDRRVSVPTTPSRLPPPNHVAAPKPSVTTTTRSIFIVHCHY